MYLTAKCEEKHTVDCFLSKTMYVNGGVSNSIRISFANRLTVNKGRFLS